MKAWSQILVVLAVLVSTALSPVPANAQEGETVYLNIAGFEQVGRGGNYRFPIWLSTPWQENYSLVDYDVHVEYWPGQETIVQFSDAGQAVDFWLSGLISDSLDIVTLRVTAHTSRGDFFSAPKYVKVVENILSFKAKGPRKVDVGEEATFSITHNLTCKNIYDPEESTLELLDDQGDETKTFWGYLDSLTFAAPANLEGKWKLRLGLTCNVFRDGEPSTVYQKSILLNGPFMIGHP